MGRECSILVFYLLVLVLKRLEVTLEVFVFSVVLGKVFLILLDGYLVGLDFFLVLSGVGFWLVIVLVVKPLIISLR